MTRTRLSTQHVPGYAAAQGETLDMIGSAFKRHLIDFEAATALRDLVRAGHPDEARAALTELAHAQPPRRRAGGRAGERSVK